jgi:hypothetical protein
MHYQNTLQAEPVQVEALLLRKIAFVRTLQVT